MLRERFERGITVLVRTDFDDEDAWATVLRRVTAPVDFLNPGAEPAEATDPGELYAPRLEVIDDPANTGVSPDDLVRLLPADHRGHGYVLLVDARSMAEVTADGELTVTYVDLSWDPEWDDTPPGRSFRVLDREVAWIEANLAISNMCFEDYFDSVDPDGVFRGFGRQDSRPEPRPDLRGQTPRDA